VKSAPNVMVPPVAAAPGDTGASALDDVAPPPLGPAVEVEPALEPCELLHAAVRAETARPRPITRVA
jgi:hypothetical protein